MMMGGKNGKNANDEKDCKTCLVIGAGNRGRKYSVYSTLFPDEMKVVGIAEPREARSKILSDLIGTVEEKNIFKDWREAAKREKFADFAVIATTDQYHKEPAVAFAKLGYHILLEKPMAVTVDDCREIVEACKSSHVTLAVCHVLRYTAWVKKIKEVIESGQIGNVVSIRHTEPIGYWHFAHSFVRGNWCKEETSTFSLMAKSCHDVDLINHWMAPRKCVSVSSFGQLTHFTKENKPAEATPRCLDCPLANTCPYSAKQIYIDKYKEGVRGWPLNVITDVVDMENITDALRNGPYGRCVYDLDNDVVSHQVSNFQFDDGATASFNMVAFTQKICAREVKVYGTKGEITFEDGMSTVQVCDFSTGNSAYHPILSDHPSKMASHGGADYHLVKAFLESLRGDGDSVVTGAEETLNSHLLVFAAETARKENRVVHFNEDGTF